MSILGACASWADGQVNLVMQTSRSDVHISDLAPGMCSERFLLSLCERKLETKTFKKEKKFTCREIARMSDFREKTQTDM